MRRSFICHRCGTVNRAAAENCAYCGLQIGWRPRLPDTLRFWRWSAARQAVVGTAAAALAALLEAVLAATMLALPPLAVSLLLLAWSYLADGGGGRERS